MTTIDHLGFPHIVELIFQYAPVESLVVMGRTCHEWMERVIDELYHLRDFSIERPNSAPGGDNGLPDWYRFETTSGRSVTVTEPAFLPFCKVIDLASELQYEEREDHTLAVDTVRLPRPFPSENPDLGCLVPFACSRVVLDNHFRLRTLREIPKLVVNFHYEGYNSHRVLWRPLPEGIRVHELVFIVDPYVSRCGVREAREDSEDRAYSIHGLLQEFSRARGHPPERTSLKLTYVANRRPKYLRSRIPDLEYMTVAEYRAEIGEEEFAIETDWERPLY